MLTLILVGCSGTMPTANTIALPKPSAPVAPIAAQVKTQTIVIRESNTEIKQGLDAAIDQLERIKAEKDATRADLLLQLDEVWDKLTNVQDHANKQWTQIKVLEETNERMTIAASTSDLEKETLRAGIAEGNNRIVALTEWQTKNAHKVNLYDWVKPKVYWILGIGAVVGIAIFVIKSYLR